MVFTVVDALVPLIAEARGLIDLRRSLTGAFPSADSPAMAERAEDAALSDVWHEQPVTAAQNYASMLVWVAEDHLESMCRLADRPGFMPIWGFAPLARALLVAAGRAVDIGEVGIGARSRVERYMNERLFALDQISDLPPGAKDPVGLRTQREEIFDSGARKGFVRKPHADAALAAAGKLAKPPQFGAGRPGYLEVVRRLFEATPDLGRGTFQWFAAASHSTAWEVEKPFKAVSSNALGRVRVELGREPHDVFLFFNAAILGYVEMVTRFFMLWGIEYEAWYKAAVNCIRISRAVSDRISAPQ